MGHRELDRLVRTCIFLPVGLRERLMASASARNVSMAQLVRVALETSTIGAHRPEPSGGFLDER